MIVCTCMRRESDVMSRCDDVFVCVVWKVLRGVTVKSMTDGSHLTSDAFIVHCRAADGVNYTNIHSAVVPTHQVTIYQQPANLHAHNQHILCFHWRHHVLMCTRHLCVIPSVRLSCYVCVCVVLNCSDYTLCLKTGPLRFFGITVSKHDSDA